MDCSCKVNEIVDPIMCEWEMLEPGRAPMMGQPDPCTCGEVTTHVGKLFPMHDNSPQPPCMVTSQ